MLEAYNSKDPYVDKEIKVPQKRFENFLNAVIDPRRSVLLLVLPQEPGSKRLTVVHEEMEVIFRGTPFENFLKSSIKDYLRVLQKLELAEIFTDYEGKQPYIEASIKAGAMDAKRAARLALNFEAQHGISLSEALGSIHRRGETSHGAPFYRALILLWLEGENKPSSRNLIASGLNINPATVGVNLNEMARAGIVGYESVKPHEGRYYDQFRDSVALSSADITQKGLTLLNNFIRPLSNIIEGQAVQLGATKIAQDAKKAAIQSSQKYMDRIKRGEEGTRNLAMKSFNDGQSQTVRSIARLYKLKEPSARQILKDLFKTGSLTRRRLKGIYYYSLNRN